MLDAYFVVARNIIRRTHRGTAPTDSPTVFHQRACSDSLLRYNQQLASGRELIHLHRVMPA
ncbi:hypothetical protein ACVW0Y_001152 [Pseudomonas sp. TE3786]